MKLENYPFSAMSEGARTAVGGGVAFLSGVFGGAALAIFVTSGHFLAWYFWFWASLWLVPDSVCKLWGLPLLPFYGAVFHGLIWKEWSRLLCFAVLAMVTSCILLVSLRFSFAEDTWAPWRFLMVEGPLCAIIGVFAVRKIRQ